MHKDITFNTINDLLKCQEELFSFLENPDEYLENKRIQLDESQKCEYRKLRDNLQRLVEDNYLNYAHNADSMFRKTMTKSNTKSSLGMPLVNERDVEVFSANSNYCFDKSDQITCTDNSSSCIDGGCAHLETICTNNNHCIDASCVNTGNSSDVGCVDSQCTDSGCLNGRNAASSGNSCTDTNGCTDNLNCTNDFGCEDDSCTDNRCNNLNCSDINTCTDSYCVNEGTCSDVGACNPGGTDVDNCTRIP